MGDARTGPHHGVHRVTRLNLGCGAFYADGWCNIDVARIPAAGINPDVVADIGNLPCADGTIDAVYAGHVIEHVPLDRFDAAMAEIRRVLNPDGGTAWFVCPDVYRAIDQYRAGQCEWSIVDACLEGPDDGIAAADAWDGAYHRWNCHAARLLALVRNTFPQATTVEIGDLPAWLPVVARVGWQCAVTVAA